jgi:hypothetical protein
MKLKYESIDAKGQEILEAIFLGFNSPKKPMIFFLISLDTP